MSEPIITGGYILLSRKIIESEIFKKPPLYLKVWVYLLSRAQHKPYKNLEKGQLFTSIPEIQEACSHMVGYRKETPTKAQIYNILEWLRFGCEDLHESNANTTMITTTRATHGLLVNVENYSVYQDSKNYESNNGDNDEKVTKVKRGQRQSNNINKNDKNDKNINKDIYSEDENLNVAITDFITFRKTMKKPMTEKAISLLLSNLDKLSKDTQEKIAIINQSILKGWTSVYPLKENTNENQGTGAKASPNNRFNNFPQRNYTKDDYNTLEQKLLEKSKTIHK